MSRYIIFICIYKYINNIYYIYRISRYNNTVHCTVYSIHVQLVTWTFLGQVWESLNEQKDVYV